jgi:hypothetical protein
MDPDPNISEMLDLYQYILNKDWISTVMSEKP